MSANTPILAASALLESVGISLADEHFTRTPERFVKWLQNATQNQNKAWPDLGTSFDGDRFDGDNLRVEGILFSSLCAHHLLPFFGEVTIETVPGKKLPGLSKYARAVEWFSLRAQTQEGLTADLADFLLQESYAHEVTVEISAVHTCMACRGVKQGAKTRTSCRRVNGDC